ncbi:MAG: hypothetical protein Q8N08_04005 [Methanobacteriaceae archaeon]|nr:hypothetical protein [Methanobacteriaceae archaeon]
MVKEHKIKFDNEMGGEFIDHGISYKKVDNNTIVTNHLKEPFVIKAGEEKTLDEETFKYLKDKGAIRSKAEQKERERLRKRLMARRSGRAEPKKEMQTISDHDKYLIFTELPYEV